MKNKIILEAETELIDNILREWVSRLESKIETINERTKSHTKEIKELQNKLKSYKGNENTKQKEVKS